MYLLVWCQEVTAGKKILVFLEAEMIDDGIYRWNCRILEFNRIIHQGWQKPAFFLNQPTLFFEFWIIFYLQHFFFCLINKNRNLSKELYLKKSN